jgi:hypothetical protein
MSDAIAALLAPRRGHDLEAEIRSFDTHLARASSNDPGPLAEDGVAMRR